MQPIWSMGMIKLIVEQSVSEKYGFGKYEYDSYLKWEWGHFTKTKQVIIVNILVTTSKGNMRIKFL